MDKSKRKKNEAEFELWVEKEDGGRIYSFHISGKSGWYAKYFKEVDNKELTIKFWQEIYDEQNILKEIHEKFPVDKGHKKLNDDNKRNNS